MYVTAYTPGGAREIVFITYFIKNPYVSLDFNIAGIILDMAYKIPVFYFEKLESGTLSFYLQPGLQYYIPFPKQPLVTSTGSVHVHKY